MTLTIAKWTIDEYHRLVETGLLDDRRVDIVRRNHCGNATRGNTS